MKWMVICATLAVCFLVGASAVGLVCKVYEVAVLEQAELALISVWEVDISQNENTLADQAPYENTELRIRTTPSDALVLEFYVDGVLVTEALYQ